ncbi:MAG TPA: hypothetical protein VF482_00040 [Trebonia sp.]
MHTIEAPPASRLLGGRRFPGRLAWGAGTVAAAAALLLCYLRVAGTVPVLSDGAGNALQAWDMWHGNPLLHGWWVTDVSFYTTELPQYALVEIVAGLRPEVVHICAAITYTLLVLLAAFVARGRARGGEGLVRALLAGGIMLAPQPGAPTWILMSSPDHVGTGVPVLILLLLLDWAKPRWWVPVAAGVLLAWSIVGDPLVLAIGVAPVAAVCLVRGCLTAWRAAPRRAWYEFSLAGAAVLAVPAALAADRVIPALGGFAINKGVSGLVPFSAMPHNLSLTGQSVLSLFGADVAGTRGGTQHAFAYIHFVGVALVAVAVVVTGWRFARSLGARAGQPDLVAELLAAAIAINVIAYFAAFRLSNIYQAHEVGPVLALGAALAGRQFGGPLLRARLVPVLAVGLACYAAMLGFAVARAQTPPSNATLATWLTRHGLHDGIAGYWQASSVTLDTGGAIGMGSVAPDSSGRLAPRHWEADMRYFNPAAHSANFLVLGPGGGVTEAEGIATFGRSVRVYRYQDYTVMVWQQNLLRKLGRSVS